MEDLTYEQTIELEESIKFKNIAQTTYNNFLTNIQLLPRNYKGDGRFLFWSDAHNATYFQLKENGSFEYQCEFLHETYSITVTPSGIFSALKNKNKGVDHLISEVRSR